MEPFRSTSPRSRSLTRSDLRLEGAQRLFRGVYVSAAADVDLVVRARAALLVHPAGVVGGVAAAAVWGSGFGAVEADVDVYVTTAGARSQPGLRAWRGALRDDEVAVVDGLRVTTPVRTALDLARHLPLAEAVAAVEALCRATSLTLGEIRAVAREHPPRGTREVGRVLDLADVRAGSPMWSRARLVLVLRGIDVPAVAYRISGTAQARREPLELAWPEVRYGLAAARSGPTVAAPSDTGWRVDPVDPGSAVDAPDRFAADVRHALRAARRRGRL